MIDQHIRNLLERLVIAEEEQAQTLKEIKEEIDTIRNDLDVGVDNLGEIKDEISNVDYTLSTIEEKMKNENE